MASAYAALVSLETIIHTIQHHPNPPISLDSHQVEALLQTLAFLLEFLQLYSHLEEYPTQDLESLIEHAAYAAEDVIESCIVDRIEESRRLHSEDNNQLRPFDLHNVIEKMDSVKKLALEIKKIPGDDDQQLEIPVSALSLPSPSSSTSPPSLGQNSTMVGFDELLENVLHRLTQDQSSRRQIIPIVGMGGIGKTTLAAKAYQHGLVKHYFDCCVWVTISQNYEPREILLEIIRQMGKEASKDERLEQIGDKIHKSLSCKRYLVVMDDMWSIEALKIIIPFLPDNRTGSRIVITTRLSNLADVAAPCSSIHMDFLDEEKSWDLFCTMVFRGAACPLELEDLGKTIARNCKGLPLSIVVIGGFLLKSERTKHHWEYVARNLSSIVNLEDNECCLKILQLSYRHLPIYLKACFLYMGRYHEDEQIRVSYLVKLLVAEGFLKPVDGKLMEAVAKEYIEQLVDRNLLLIDERGSTGSIKFCKIHDLVRDLCIREAKKENFLYIVDGENLHIQGDISAQRRIVLCKMNTFIPEPRVKLHPASLARSLTFHEESICVFYEYFKLLRIWNSEHPLWSFAIPQLHNSRFMRLYFLYGDHSLCWNLHTINIEFTCVGLEIWNMPQLRHVMVQGGMELSPPGNNIVLRNLQSLYTIITFECSKEVVERLPNIQKLGIRISKEGITRRFDPDPDYCCLNNLEHLHKLEHLKCHIMGVEFHLQGNITFPHSLKKLHLRSVTLRWEDVTTMIGSLPNLEKLELWGTAGSEWRPTTGQFLLLKSLQLIECLDLKHWTADSCHFPLLERLCLWGLNQLAEIPSGIAEIPTLKLIEMSVCNYPAEVSAKTIAEEQDALGNSELQIRIIRSAFDYGDPQIKSLESASQNFQVEIRYWI